ncbi:hypothetical protein HOLleu_24711 [Holothuria leucospilota]|uniref:F-box domain-containing protein n=1 Tax=Holothuria leucospilota TaxID=206669 RepID=A0A9Q1BR29_HOLLE|nr:hypothetical protein HOLleu_24711 [Holothuria leucospilota]
MEKLPIEVLTHIMLFLPTKNRKLCAYVCKKWYSAMQDRRLSSRLFCRLLIFEEPEKCREIASFAHRRNITNLSICGCSRGHINGKCQITTSAWYGNEGMFWNTISNQFQMITTFYLANIGHTDLMEELLVNFASLFPSVKTLKLEAGFLFDVTKSTLMRKKVLSGLEKIQQLILIMKGESYNSNNLQWLMELNLNFHTVLVKEYDFVIWNAINETSTYFKSDYKSITPLSVFTSFCSRLGCAVHFECINVNLLELPEVVTKLGSIPKLKTKCLNLRHCSNSITDEKSSFLHQISEFGLTSLYVHSQFYVHNWLSKEFLLSVIVKFQALETIECFGKFDKTTLDQMFSYFTFTESVHVSFLQYGNFVRSIWIKVRFRTSLHGHLRTISLISKNSEDVKVLPHEIFYVLPLHLRELEVMVDKLDKATILNLIELRKRCPKLGKVPLRFAQNTVKDWGTFMSQLREKNETEGLELHHDRRLIVSPSDRERVFVVPSPPDEENDFFFQSW